ncbi:MAG TPA: carbamoyltransferase HypF [Bacteroides sp.]|nr:carbamoyltransferase HypF [Bacteroides sp.]
METKKTYLTTILGLVQGVGFRPFIYRLAHDFGLKGWVNNTNENVQICVNADLNIMENFILQIKEQAPRASQIESIELREVKDELFADFRIIRSESLSEAITEVSPDIAVCDDCLQDMKLQSNRIDYPFLNCTNCGPRFTIVQDLPFDRAHTTMKDFTMCESCGKEYGNVLDRRFHAQPTACRDCGPEYSLAEGDITQDTPGGSSLSNNPTYQHDSEIISKTASLIDAGKIVSVKGLGGFFMACDAQNEETVRRLRESKHREGKPFAVMFREIDAIHRFCELTTAEKETLESWRRPIVILRNREILKQVRNDKTRQDDKPDQDGLSIRDSKSLLQQLAPSVSNGFPTTGVMLPYMPLHYLLFEKLQTPAIVLTSGNLSEEPILIDNKKAEFVLGPVSRAVLHFNRDIHNRCDDSVAIVINKEPRLLRRSRGYVPSPIRTKLETEGIFASGAELVNCFAIGKGEQVIMSQHIGDLKNFETLEFYTETFERFQRLFRLKPTLVAHDLHPDYLSTRFAQDMGLPAVPVQHHHAHIASVLAEHGLDEKVIGVSFDGTGLGDDNNIWGSEFLVCDLEEYDRITHLEYIPMPGGDKSTSEPWRLAVSYLYKIHGRELAGLNLPFLTKIDPAALDLVILSIEKNINCPLSSGAGRLFDAVSALLNVCTISQFHAEAPMRLEAEIQKDDGIYSYESHGLADQGEVIGVGPIIENIIKDIGRGINSGVISARFHNTMSTIILETVLGISKDHGIKKVALSGGIFQNRYLSERIENQLQEKGFEVLVPLQLPANDGGIALGQLAIAAKRCALSLI